MLTQGHDEGATDPGTREYLLASICLIVGLAAWETMGIVLVDIEVRTN